MADLRCLNGCLGRAIKTKLEHLISGCFYRPPPKIRLVTRGKLLIYSTMKKDRFSESKMVKMIKRLEAGETPMALCKELGISKTSLYKWESQYSGMEVSQVKRLKALKDKSRRRKRMYAELSLDNELLKEVREKNLASEVKEEIVTVIVSEHEHLSIS